MLGDAFTVQSVFYTGSRVDIRHGKVLRNFSAKIVAVKGNKVTVNFRRIPGIDFEPFEPIVVYYNIKSELMVSSARILSVNKDFDEFEQLIFEITSIERKVSQRKYERYYINNPASVVSEQTGVEFAGVCLDISLGGVKISIPGELDVNARVKIIIDINEYNNIKFTGEIVRVSKVFDNFEYGIRIIDLSKTNQLTLYHFIESLNF